MAVYTHVAEAELEAFLRLYDVGTLTRYEGVAQGVENTNYIVSTSGGRFVLTLFERRVATEDVPYFLAVMAHFAASGAPAPSPIVMRDGRRLGELAGRPAIMISFLEGAPDMAPSPARARALGRTLAGLHENARGFGGDRTNPLSVDGWRELAAACSARLQSVAETPDWARDAAALAEDEAAALARDWPDEGTAGLPRGLVHADLFPDNVFFRGAAVSGVIDFYFSCTDFFAYDLAICLNAWCSAISCRAAPGDAVWLADNAAALMAGYAEVRDLSGAERAALPLFLRGSALRFMLTRLYDYLHQVDGAVVQVKDPREYERLLRRHREADPSSP